MKALKRRGLINLGSALWKMSSRRVESKEGQFLQSAELDKQMAKKVFELYIDINCKGRGA